VSSVAFTVGALTTGLGLYLYLAHDRDPPRLSATLLSIRGGTALGLSGRF
jgi:hypothetical protein